ncbi:hypothetical protein [Pararhodobacter sp.]|uniref:hypothetical protein n=1 Tax=Pararhodobacter sp. TaxID=2127056 RepID=UPI002FDF1106
MADKTFTPSADEILGAIITLYHAVDAGVLAESVYADLARMRIAYVLAFPPSAEPCEPVF